jgi:phosphatidylglycerol---prolipoprotein diacylglyceryl transferase
MHPVAFHIPYYWNGSWHAITIYWYGVLVATGFLMGLWTASRRAARDGLTAERIMDLGPWLIVGGIAGARTLYVMSYWREQFANQPWTEMLMIQKSGLVFYGGLIGSILATLVYAWVKKISVWKLGDALAPSIALGYFFGRFGCLMTGCCYGRGTDLPWGIRFPEGHQAFGYPVHPTQVYEAVLNLGLYFGLAWLYRRKKFDGQVFAAYVIAYPVFRSFVELFRGDYPHYYGGWVTPAQLVSLGIFTAGVILFLLLYRQFKATAGVVPK